MMGAGVDPVILQGDARCLDLPGGSVDLIVTSPPYFSLRDYGVDGQIGTEATPQGYVAALVGCTREMVRVLKPSGSIFVNLGDKYAQNTERSTKSLMLLPERYRIAAVDELGLIARAVIVWSKPNGLPESVKDRVKRSHEDWVHLTKSPKYYTAVDEIREPVNLASVRHAERYGGRYKGGAEDGRDDSNGRNNFTANPLGKLPGSVWEIATQPLKVPVELGVDHYAAFPMEWPRRLIQGWCPREVCTACGQGRRPVTEKSEPYNPHQNRYTDIGRYSPDAKHGTGPTTLGYQRDTIIAGYACACPDNSAPATPGIVLDPFGGTGTTALVATALGRQGISVDLSADYCRLADWRVNDPKQRERAARSAVRRITTGTHEKAPRSGGGLSVDGLPAGRRSEGDPQAGSGESLQSGQPGAVLRGPQVEVGCPEREEGGVFLGGPGLAQLGEGGVRGGGSDVLHGQTVACPPHAAQGEAS